MKRTLRVCFAILLAATPGIADHLPARLMARGKPETTLAGINLETTAFAQVLARYGPPTKQTTAPNNPAWTGYLWQMPGMRLEVEVSRSGSKPSIDTITIVRTGASGEPTALQASGSGLKLGDTLGTLKKVYGPLFELSRQQPVSTNTEPFLSVPGTQTAIVQWASMDFTLTAGLDAQGRIVALRLRLPECYPDGCQ